MTIVLTFTIPSHHGPDVQSAHINIITSDDRSNNPHAYAFHQYGTAKERAGQ